MLMFYKEQINKNLPGDTTVRGKLLQKSNKYVLTNYNREFVWVV